MQIRIRTKLLIGISLLFVILFSVAAYLFITEKKRELGDDIYLNSLSFVKLTAPIVAKDYDLYLAQNSFVYFNREIQSIFKQNGDLASIKVISYPGEILYDSAIDLDKKYSGPLRGVTDQLLLEQVQSENISFLTLNGDIFYLNDEAKNGDVFVDKDDNLIPDLTPGTLIDYFVIPASEKHSIVYSVDYHNLDERVALIINRIVYLVLFGVLLGVIWSFWMSLHLTKPVALLVKGAENIAKGDFKTRVNIKTHDELKFLGDAFNRMAIDLAASLDAKLYQERITRELELAKEIQAQLLPDVIPSISGIEISADLIPAGEIGGDMYDFLKMDDNRLIFYLGDVTGHGVPAGIVSSIASALFYGFSGLGDLKKVMVDVNRVLNIKTLPSIFMTLCLMQWDALNSKFHYVSAGHEQIIHYSAANKTATLAPAGGMALGMISDLSRILKTEEVPLGSGDFLIVYSDGIPEAWKNRVEAYGMERFTAFVQQNGGLPSATALRDAILTDLRTFMGEYPQADDITIIVIKKL